MRPGSRGWSVKFHWLGCDGDHVIFSENDDVSGSGGKTGIASGGLSASRFTQIAHRQSVCEPRTVRDGFSVLGRGIVHNQDYTRVADGIMTRPRAVRVWASLGARLRVQIMMEMRVKPRECLRCHEASG